MMIGSLALEKRKEKWYILLFSINIINFLSKIQALGRWVSFSKRQHSFVSNVWDI